MVSVCQYVEHMKSLIRALILVIILNAVYHHHHHQQRNSILIHIILILYLNVSVAYKYTHTFNIEQLLFINSFFHIQYKIILRIRDVTILKGASVILVIGCHLS